MTIPWHKLNDAVKLACPGRDFSLSPETYDGLTMLDGGPKPTIEELETAWENRPPDIKTWLSVEEFVDEFTLEECAAIELSSNAQIAALRFKLKTWQSAVHANNQLVQDGMSALVSEGIITEERKNGILLVV